MTPAMASSPSSRSAMEIELTKLSSPRIFLVRMVVFLVLCALVTIVLYKQIVVAFFANPGLNALIGAVLLIGTILSFRQVIRLYPEVTWVNNFRIADPGLALERHPTLLAPMAAILGGERSGRMTISQQTMRHLLDSIAARLDEARDISRYMTGLLVFLGLLGTFWGLIETVGSVGKVIDGLKVGGVAADLEAVDHLADRADGFDQAPEGAEQSEEHQQARHVAGNVAGLVEPGGDRVQQVSHGLLRDRHPPRSLTAENR